MEMATADIDGQAVRPHVVHVVLSLNVGGLERNVVNQVREGRKLGQRVSVLCLDDPGTLAAQVITMGSELISLSRRPGLRPGMVLQVRRALQALRPDVVHTHQLATLLYGGAAAKMLRVPVVLHTEHGREPYASRWRTRLLGRVAGRCCDRFYCLTADMANEVRSARIVSDRKISVIQNGIDVSRFTEVRYDTARLRQSLAIPPHAPFIGTVGRLTEIKRQDLLIRAFAKVREHVRDAFLVLVGEGPLLDSLRELAWRLGVADCVRFVGYQPHSGPYLQAMNVFALTSRSEGMPQAVLEALVTGLPVVASRVGGLPEVIEDGVTGMLFESGNETALAEILHELIRDREKAHRLGTAARASVESRFSVARMAADYHRDMFSLLGHRVLSGGNHNSAPLDAAGSFAMEDAR